MVLLSLALVVAATLLLVLGLVGDGELVLILLSVACSGGAALLLAAWWRRGRLTLG